MNSTKLLKKDCYKEWKKLFKGSNAEGPALALRALSEDVKERRALDKAVVLDCP